VARRRSGACAPRSASARMRRPDCPNPYVCKNGDLNNGAGAAVWTYAGILKCNVPVVVVANSPLPSPYQGGEDIIGLVKDAYNASTVPGTGSACPRESIGPRSRAPARLGHSIRTRKRRPANRLAGRAKKPSPAQASGRPSPFALGVGLLSTLCYPSRSAR
jgi:hypothetical protein